ncbi:hypothetical protein HDU98_001460 [Podochytrium sp. JEL0797]|nr:hypothetical protein HDU98_001460 [Podochytrium sp. JEL0797]
MISRAKGNQETWLLQDASLSAVFILRAKAQNSVPKTVFVMIPGNPGVIEYYSDFCNALYNNAMAQSPSLNLDVIALQHPGHSAMDFDSVSTTSFSPNAGDPPIPSSASIIQSWNNRLNFNPTNDPLSLQNQCDHKIALFDHIKSLYPADTTFVISGHSIGAFMALHLLKHRSTQISKSILLFPTLTDIAATPRGQNMQWIVMPGVRHVLVALLWFWRPVLRLFPVLFYTFVAWGTGLAGDALRITCEQLLHPSSASHVTSLGHDEMQTVKQLDSQTIAQNQSKLILYYGPEDGWANESYFNDIVNEFPGIHAVLCEDAVPHDFVIHHSERMARKVAPWLVEKKNQ